MIGLWSITPVLHYHRSCHTVIHAPDGSTALRLASEQSFDLLVSDLGLPDMTGLELMRQLKSQHGMIGVAISGYGMESDIARSKEAGFAEHLTKPITLVDLEAAIKQALSGRQT